VRIAVRRAQLIHVALLTEGVKVNDSKLKLIALLAVTLSASVLGPAHADDSSQHLLGDWGGIRGALAYHGVDLQLSYVNEVAGNVRGGDRRETVYADQLYLGGSLDLERLLDLPSSKLVFTATNRNGDNLAAKAHLNTLMLVDEVWGQGSYTRLNQFYWQQRLFDGALDLKFGRLSGSFEFMPFSCEFQNLTFCGTLPAYMTPNWVPFPGSTWAGVAKLQSRTGWYLQGGVYEVNPDYQQHKYTTAFGTPFSGPGKRFLTELGWLPKTAGLPGSYRVGAWYDDVGGSDLFFNGAGQPLVTNGGTPLQRSHQAGFYAMAQQQVWANNGSAARGVSLFMNFVQGDRDIALKSQIAEIGLFWTGPLAARPQDDLGFAIGRVQVSNRVTDGELLYNAEAVPGSGLAPMPVQHAEFPLELYYSVKVTPAFTLRPNVQLIHAPGGVDERSEVVVLGLKTVVNL
jgi:porin